MGLDQFLTARKSFYPFGSEQDKTIETRDKIYEAIGFDSPSPFVSSNGVSVSVPAGYWRKANQVHAWFLNHGGIEVDDCQQIYITSESLEELGDACRKVLAARGTPQAEDVAEELLPTSSGFFFGSTDYDDWYYAGLEQTIEIVNFCLEGLDGWEFEYQASW